MIHVGLTGGLCTGKSTVASMFAELGAPVIDADVVVHELLAGDPAVQRRVVEAFGEGVRGGDGSIDRGKLAAAAFGDKASIATLTGILYPAVREWIAGWFAEQKEDGAPAAIAEVSMLYEGGATHIYDVIAVVTADPAAQLERFITRGGTPEDFSARVRHQLALDEKMKKADYVINNNGMRETTREQVEDLWEVLQERAGREAGANAGDGAGKEDA